MSLLDTAGLSRLQIEFRQSMRSLLLGLCRDIARHYGDLADQLDLPVDYFRFLAQSLDRTLYSNWKVVGWIETLNDVVYFLDVLAQARRQRNQRMFAGQLFTECEQQFFEHAYADELFPQGHPQAEGLNRRLEELCARLARESTQESLFFNPQWPMQWLKGQGRACWKVTGGLDASFERGEEAMTLPIGVEGAALVLPRAVNRAVGRRSSRVTFTVTGDEILLDIGRSFQVCSRQGRRMRWHWPWREAVKAAATPCGALTVGPTLRYGKDREPKAVSATPHAMALRIARAWKTISRAWPEGHHVLELLTSRIIPLKAQGVVSFSYRHRPGLSFINCFDRDNLDLIDDLIHENSHHHLNLLLRKLVLYRDDDNQQIFYSPWRRSLRPLRGILHAAFTFTMGALLFERLCAWGETKQGMAQWREAGLTGRQLLRARLRCLEEVESVRYSIQDLQYAGCHLKWLTRSGSQLVTRLETAIMGTDEKMSPHRRAVLGSPLGPSLLKHIEALRKARQTYGPMKLNHT